MGIILHNNVDLDEVVTEKVVYIAQFDDLLGHSSSKTERFDEMLLDLKNRKQMHEEAGLNFKINSIKRYTITNEDVTKNFTDKL